MQALYQLDLRGPAFLEGLDEFLRDSSKEAEVIAWASALAYGCIEKRDSLDAAITAAAEHWDVTRMAAVDRAIIRLGAYELLHRPDVPPKVAIDEAIRLAKKFSTAESGAFVNGVLDKVMARRTAKPAATEPRTKR